MIKIIIKEFLIVNIFCIMDYYVIVRSILKVIIKDFGVIKLKDWKILTKIIFTLLKMKLVEYIIVIIFF
jgi:hypothetical protein